MRPAFLCLALVLTIAAPMRADDPAPEATAAGFESADALLDALETADAHIRTLEADIVYDRVFMLQGDRHVRYGRLSFRVDPSPPGGPPARTFAIHFDSLVLDGAIRDDRQAWIFDGHWLVEKRFAEKQYIARQITKPGTRVDPLRLGEGPLPIPIGQRKADILDRYSATLLAWDDGFDPEDESHRGYMRWVSHASQILLEPHAHRLDQDDFRSIRLWYSRDEEGTLLPILSRTVDRKGDEAFVLLSDTVINQPIPPKTLNIEPPPEQEGWHIQSEEWRSDDEVVEAEPADEN